MLACKMCGKGVNTIAYSRHKKGSSGAGGTWALRAPIHKRLQRPNLQTFHGMKICTKCIKTLKNKLITPAGKVEETLQEAVQS